MVSIYIVLTLVTIFSSFTETLGSEDEMKFQLVPIRSPGDLATVAQVRANQQNVANLLNTWTVALLDGGKMHGTGHGGNIIEGDFTGENIDEKIIILSGSGETKILDDILAEMNQMSSECPRMEKLIRQVENLRDSHILTNTTTPTTPLPVQPSACSSYRPLTDSWRHIDYINRGNFPKHCDKTGSDSSFGVHTNLALSWYRFTGAAGTKLPTTTAPVGGRPSEGNQICGAGGVAYIKSGGNPTIQDGIVTRKVCFEWDVFSCWRKTTVQVAACRDIHGDFFVYQLKPVPVCQRAYCAID